MLGEPLPLDPLALLARPELPIALAQARSFLRGRRILVTGAGGSVGAALSALLLSFEPSLLILLDHHEHSLFELSRGLGKAPLASSPRVELALADVRNMPKLVRLMERHRPEVVFHLAAYKHVPLGEQFPDELVSTNVLATRKLLAVCGRTGVEAFGYPSSDKAVNPPSLYGATKRLGEMLVLRAAAEGGRAYRVARYVNIIGTHGSVIESMARQVARGEPMTVTDPAMARYWITMSEAQWLLAGVVACASAGPVAMLDARQEISVVEMGQRLARGLRPGNGPYPVVFTGPRPGERLHEELLSASESFAPGPFPGTLTVLNQRLDQCLERVEALVGGLAGQVERGELESLRRAAMAAAMELQ